MRVGNEGPVGALSRGEAPKGRSEGCGYARPGQSRVRTET